MSAAEVVGSALFGLAAPCSRKDAQYILDALKAAGYAVVELPKPAREEHHF
jgi:hypothetical protein